MATPPAIQPAIPVTLQDPFGNSLQSPLLVENVGGSPMVLSFSANGGNASIAATLPAVAGQSGYITGFEISSDGSTGGSGVLATLTGVATLSGTAVVAGTLSYAYTAQATVLVGGSTLVCEFNPPLSTPTQNQAVTLTLPALGSGNTNATVCLHGYTR